MNDEQIKRAREEILDGAQAYELAVLRESGTGAAPTYTLVLHMEGQERVLACRMFKSDACGIAHALAVVLDCPKVTLP